MNIQKYPLSWPEGWSRTESSKESRFDTSLASARDGLLHELRLLGAKNIILSTNIPLRIDGLPYARYKAPEDSGVAVYFQRNGEPQVIACYKWNKIEDNMQSLRKTVEAMRGIERWGSSEILKRAFMGFKALAEQAGPSSGNAWWVILDVDPGLPLPDIERAYRVLAKKYHTDQKTGSHEHMVKLNLAIEQARKEKA